MYLTRLKKTDELFAIKSIRINSVDCSDKTHNILQIQEERDILIKIKHPYIVKLKAAFQSSKRFFLVMNFIQGGELLQYIKRTTNKIREEACKFYAAEIALAIYYLHRQGIIYGDLKPENILIDKYGHAKLTDFGASKLINSQTSAIGFAGTPDYLAPEVLKHKKVTKASDWWTFGILLYEMLFGNSPFHNEDMKAMFKSILTENPKFPYTALNSFSRDCIDLIRKLLKKNPKNRLGSENSAHIFDDPWFSTINFQKLEANKLMAPIIPNIENEASVENFDYKITKESLKLSFELPDDLHFYNKTKKIDSAELLDFDYIDENFTAETPMYDVKTKSNSFSSIEDKFINSNKKCLKSSFHNNVGTRAKGDYGADEGVDLDEIIVGVKEENIIGEESESTFTEFSMEEGVT